MGGSAVPVPVASVGLFDTTGAFEPERLLTGVAPRERERYRAQRQPARARQYLASRWLLRAHLASELGISAPDVPLQDAADGPPRLQDIGTHLGLSHSGALCLCIMSAQIRVGCDVERHRRRRSIHDIAAQYFHPLEAACLQTTDDGHALDDFYRLWTLKEAARKALGQGIDHGLRTPAFRLRPDLRCLQPPGPAPWTFAACTHADSYSLALAIRAPSRPQLFDVHHYEPGRDGVIRRRFHGDWILTGAGD